MLQREQGCPEFDGFEPVAIRSHDGRYVAGSASVPLACGFKAPDVGVALAATKQIWHMVNVSAGPPSVAGPGHHWEYHGAASISTTNPFNGNAFGFNNHQAADACYVTNLIFAGSVMFTVAQTHIGAETTLLTTRFTLA